MKLQLHGLRSAFLRGGSNAWWSGSGAMPMLSGVSPAQQTQQSRSIVTKEFLFLPDDYPDAWPYRDEGWVMLMITCTIQVMEGSATPGGT